MYLLNIILMSIDVDLSVSKIFKWNEFYRCKFGPSNVNVCSISLRSWHQNPRRYGQRNHELIAPGDRNTTTTITKTRRSSN